MKTIDEIVDALKSIGALEGTKVIVSEAKYPIDEDGYGRIISDKKCKLYVEVPDGATVCLYGYKIQVRRSWNTY